MRNGAGKSPAVRILATLPRPDADQASVLGLDVARRAEEVRAAIGLADLGGPLAQFDGQRGAPPQHRVSGLVGRFRDDRPPGGQRPVGAVDLLGSGFRMGAGEDHRADPGRFTSVTVMSRSRRTMRLRLPVG